VRALAAAGFTPADLSPTFNVALPPGTDDGGWLRAFGAVVPGAVRAFGPDVLVTQCGCDTHHEDPLANLGLLLFPAITLGLALAGATMRMTRSAMLDVLGADYVRTATAKGLAPSVVVRRHVLKNGLIVVVTLLGIQVGQLLGGTVVVEEIFSVPGVGRMLLAAIVQRDYALVQGAVLGIAVLFVGVNIVVDLLYGYLDPRIRLG